MAVYPVGYCIFQGLCYRRPVEAPMGELYWYLDLGRCDYGADT
jgi:hypothetical protein